MIKYTSILHHPLTHQKPDYNINNNVLISTIDKQIHRLKLLNILSEKYTNYK